MNEKPTISQELQEILLASIGIYEQFKTIAQWLDQRFNVQVYFCEITGPRWSYITGKKISSTPIYKTILSHHYGMITGTVRVEHQQWHEIIIAINNTIEEHYTHTTEPERSYS